MRNSDYMDRGLLFPIHNRKRETSQDEFPSAVFADGPPPWRSHYKVNRTVQFGRKVNRSQVAPL